MFRFDGFSDAKVNFFFLSSKFMWLSTPKRCENPPSRDETHYIVANAPSFLPILAFVAPRRPAREPQKVSRRGPIIATFSAKRRLWG